MKKVLAIIPARYGSTRFPGKPLAMLGGKTMIERVFRQVSACTVVDEIFVATDDERIFKVVEEFGGNVVYTSEACLSGTDRCAEALKKIDYSPELVLNVQGDEPFIQPEQLIGLISCMRESSADVGTLIQKIHREEDLLNPNVVKTVVSSKGKALYFSRSAIPFVRDAGKSAFSEITFFRHLGIYAFRSSVLPLLASLPPGKLELAESLEQLRWLEAGYSIFASETEFDSIGIDTPEDLEAAQQRLLPDT